MFIDFAVNDQNEDPWGSRVYGFRPCYEALIRKVWTTFPNCMIVTEVFTWPDGYSHMFGDTGWETGNGRRGARDKALAVCAHYGLMPYVMADDLIANYMPSPYTDSDVEVYFYSPGNVHPNNAGHAVIAAALEKLLASGIYANEPSPFPDPLYGQEALDFMADPQIRNAVDADSRSGTWATSGTSLTSSTVGSTLTFTFSGIVAFGWDTNKLNDYRTSKIGWTLDGGAETIWDINGNDQQVDVQAIYNWPTDGLSHTIVLRVAAGTVTINRLLTI